LAEGSNPSALTKKPLKNGGFFMER